MPRPSVVVRDATTDDCAALLAMWTQLRAVGRNAAPPPSEQGVLSRLRHAQIDPDLRIVVGVIDGEVAGMAVMTHLHFAVLFEAPSVHLNFMHVREQFRRRGVGRALVAAAASYAEEVGSEQLVTSVYPQLRETNRFYARLGFAPAVMRRTTTVSAVRRRLAADTRSAPVDDLVARRRSMRTRSRLRALTNLANVSD